MMIHSHYLDKKTTAYFSEALLKHCLKNPNFNEVVIVCIGTSRSSGDSLGPRVGTRLTERFEGHRRVHIYGTMDEPIHALNLQQTLSHIAIAHNQAYIIAVDACLGQFYKIGTLQFVEEPLQPGAGLDKQLPSVGHVHFKGIINNHGLLNYKVLEHTSLTFVDEMAAVISRILVKSCQDIVARLLPEEEPAGRTSIPFTYA